MATGAAEGRVEMPGASSEGSGRKPQEYGRGAANGTGRRATHWPEAATQLMEAIVSRGNMMAAYSRVVSNKGAPGVDEMPVTALKGAACNRNGRASRKNCWRASIARNRCGRSKYPNREAVHGCWAFPPSLTASFSRPCIRF